MTENTKIPAQNSNDNVSVNPGGVATTRPNSAVEPGSGEAFGGEAKKYASDFIGGPQDVNEIPGEAYGSGNAGNGGNGAVTQANSRDAVTQTNPTSNTSNSDYSSDTIGSLSPTMLEVLDTLRNILRMAYYGSSGVLNPAFTAVDSALDDWNTKIEDLKNQLAQALMSK